MIVLKFASNLHKIAFKIPENASKMICYLAENVEKAPTFSCKCLIIN